jgi:ATP-binding protein involved in chromosome partitioning
MDVAENDETAPVEVGPTEDGTQLRIRWADGAVSDYHPRYLRLSCPCAGCVEEMTGRPLLDPARVPMDVYPRAVEYVGDYALRFEWSDGHNTGIYPFTYLREIALDT